MSNKNEITEWLEIPDEDKVFAEGYKLFCKYSRNRSVINFLARKQRMSKLVYELDKMKDWELKEKKVISKPLLKVIESSVSKTEQKEKDPVKEQKNVKREDLPEELKEVFDKISEAYKIMRAKHEKLKLLTNDIDRSDLIKEIHDLDDHITEGWKTIDNFVENKTENTDTNSQTVNTTLDPKKVSRDRKYITQGLKDLEKLTGEENQKKRDGKIQEMNKRFNDLLSGGENFADETIEKLKIYGIEIKC
ncbi:MAG: hypothetical protein N4A72_00855 [Bacteroidales bacterium]|jgi:hypothetical protein|nr:hypothetical protein [Bacteroidales bacterium]